MREKSAWLWCLLALAAHAAATAPANVTGTDDVEVTPTRINDTCLCVGEYENITITIEDDDANITVSNFTVSTFTVSNSTVSNFTETPITTPTKSNVTSTPDITETPTMVTFTTVNVSLTSLPTLPPATEAPATAMPATGVPATAAPETQAPPVVTETATLENATDTGIGTNRTVKRVPVYRAECCVAPVPKDDDDHSDWGGLRGYWWLVIGILSGGAVCCCCGLVLGMAKKGGGGRERGLAVGGDEATDADLMTACNGVEYGPVGSRVEVLDVPAAAEGEGAVDEEGNPEPAAPRPLSLENGTWITGTVLAWRPEGVWVRADNEPAARAFYGIRLHPEEVAKRVHQQQQQAAAAAAAAATAAAVQQPPPVEAAPTPAPAAAEAQPGPSPPASANGDAGGPVNPLRDIKELPPVSPEIKPLENGEAPAPATQPTAVDAGLPPVRTMPPLPSLKMAPSARSLAGSDHDARESDPFFKASQLRSVEHSGPLSITSLRAPSSPLRPAGSRPLSPTSGLPRVATSRASPPFQTLPFEYASPVGPAGPADIDAFSTAVASLV